MSKKVHIVKVFNNVFDAFDHVNELEKYKDKLEDEPIIYAKYRKRKCTATVVYNIK